MPLKNALIHMKSTHKTLLLKYTNMYLVINLENTCFMCESSSESQSLIKSSLQHFLETSEPQNWL